MDVSSYHPEVMHMFDFNDIAPMGHEDPSNEAMAFLEDAKQCLTFAFQPIVDIHNGTVFGYEALMRGFEAMAGKSVFEIIDRAHDFGILHRFDMVMRTKAVAKFSMLPRSHKTKLFYNLDNRIIHSPDYFQGATKTLLAQYGLPRSTLCLEISERHEVSMSMAEKNLARYRGEDYSTAIDDFGAGYSGLKLLQEYQPDFLKIDRSFIVGIETDKKRKLMVSTITDLAHVLGIFVIAEGVETKEELAVCKEIGCDLVQGYYVSYPQIDIEALTMQYPQVIEGGRRHKNPEEGSDTQKIYELIEYRPPLRIDDDMGIVIEAFRSNKDMTFFPVVDESGSPMGIVREHALKEYTYSPFGKDLMANRATGLTLRKFISACPVADIQASAQSILENFSLSESPEGIIMVKEFGYLGFLSAASLLRVINENNLAQARDCNPLTKLAGNSSIASYVSNACADTTEHTILIYLDLDNFKAFNDVYGFRQGDRAIMLFAELMKKTFAPDSSFLAHVGGDDFFIGLKQDDVIGAKKQLEVLLRTFRQDVESFYDPEVRERGYLEGKDRHGVHRHFPIMSCSAGLLYLPAGRDENTPSHTDLDSAIARLKKEAKNSDEHVTVHCF